MMLRQGGKYLTLALLLSCAACVAPSDGATSLGSDADTSPPQVFPPLVTEAGFFDVPPQPTAASYPARMFYVFRPADEDAAHKPLMVLFNGGPGYPTSLGLLAYGTGPVTLQGDTLVPNPSSFTRFANLLYVDERMAGFSYGIGRSSLPNCMMSEVEDASDFVRVLLSFFDTHPALMAAPVVLVGESYGGTRATHMLDLLLRYETEAILGGADLPALIQAHYDKAFPDHAGSPLDEATAAKQFGAQVLIEPLVLGHFQYEQQQIMMPQDPYVGQLDPNEVDVYNGSKPVGWSDSIDLAALRTISDVTASETLFGVKLESIPILAPSARAEAFHVGGFWDPAGADETNEALTTRLGQLGPNDAYYFSMGQQCPMPPNFMNDTYDTYGHMTANVFFQNLFHVRTFITHARYDMVIYAPAIPAAFQAQGLGGSIDDAPRPGVDRPGWFTVTLREPTNLIAPTQTIEVRFPLYDASGHAVSVTQPAELAADVEAWLSHR